MGCTHIYTHRSPTGFTSENQLCMFTLHPHAPESLTQSLLPNFQHQSGHPTNHTKVHQHSSTTRIKITEQELDNHQSCTAATTCLFCAHHRMPPRKALLIFFFILNYMKPQQNDSARMGSFSQKGIRKSWHTFLARTQDKLFSLQPMELLCSATPEFPEGS